MKYRHIKTGVVIETKSEITGKNWEPAEAPVVPVKTTTRKKGTTKK